MYVSIGKRCGRCAMRPLLRGPCQPTAPLTSLSLFKCLALGPCRTGRPVVGDGGRSRRSRLLCSIRSVVFFFRLSVFSLAILPSPTLHTSLFVARRRCLLFVFVALLCVLVRQEGHIPDGRVCAIAIPFQRCWLAVAGSHKLFLAFLRIVTGSSARQYAVTTHLHASRPSSLLRIPTCIVN